MGGFTSKLIHSMCETRSAYVTLPDYVSIACELLMNALDSGATHITLTFEIINERIKCRDNGCGIPSNALQNIFNSDYTFQNDLCKYKRNEHHLLAISKIGKMHIQTLQRGEDTPRNKSHGRLQQLAPIIGNGTCVMVSNIFEDYFDRRKFYTDRNVQKESFAKLKTFVNTISLDFPNVEIEIISGYIKHHLTRCATKSDRWRQITGSFLRISVDKDVTSYHSALTSTLSFFTNFYVNNFPCCKLFIEGEEIESKSSLLVFSGKIITFEWDIAGPIITLGLEHEIIDHDAVVGNNELKEMEVIGIFDSKFIIAHIGKMIYAIDQHAAHERVNLEILVNTLPSVLESKELEKPFPMSIDIATPQADLAQLKRWGWDLVQIGGKMILSAVPCLFNKPVDDIDGLMEFISQISSNNCPKVPRCIMHVLQTRACKKAIKFGDIISKEFASDLIKALSECQLPNHCAHGRTVAVPIYDINKPEIKYTAV